MKILAVDDEYFALELMRRSLEEVAINSEIYLCKDASGALEVARENVIDVASTCLFIRKMQALNLHIMIYNNYILVSSLMVILFILNNFVNQYINI